jgi:Tfp pilus assembly protein PilX
MAAEERSSKPNGLDTNSARLRRDRSGATTPPGWSGNGQSLWASERSFREAGFYQRNAGGRTQDGLDIEAEDRNCLVYKGKEGSDDKE